jgi:hypothetical protein
LELIAETNDRLNVQADFSLWLIANYQFLQMYIGYTYIISSNDFRTANGIICWYFHRPALYLTCLVLSSSERTMHVIITLKSILYSWFHSKYLFYCCVCRMLILISTKGLITVFVMYCIVLSKGLNQLLIFS